MLKYLTALALVTGIMACNESSRTANGQNLNPAASANQRASADTTPQPLLPVVRVPTPDTLRGLYVNRWASLGTKMWQLIDLGKRTEVNALVLDVKDDRGFVLYRSNVPLAQEIGADTNQPMTKKRLQAILDSMRLYNIYPIARIVVAKDPLLASKKLEWSIKRKKDMEPWLDRNKKPWLDPHHREVWAYAAELAREAYELGFSEVQFDYVRFPDEKNLIREAAFPLANGRVRAQVIREQLGFIRQTLKPTGMPVTIDVFGLTATDTTDMGIGQRWEMFIDQADVVLPMVYPSHYAPGTYKLGNPNANPYSTIDHSLKDMARRSKNVPNVAKIIPWYQDFTLGPPRYGAEQVRAQIKAGYDNGVHSWILWNPRSAYTIAALRAK